MKNKNDYQELLKDPKWISKRNQILSRDKNTCQFCGAQDKYLHVHHKEYWDGHLPWEYPDEMLITLCDECHRYMHENTSTDVSKIGDVFNFFHSDWCMTCIVYDVDTISRQVRFIGIDDGGGSDSIYEDAFSFDFFRHKCVNVEREEQCNFYFREWFGMISRSLDRTPRAFRYNFQKISESVNLLLNDR